MNKITLYSKEYGIFLNNMTTMFLGISKNGDSNRNLTIGQEVERFKKYMWELQDTRTIILQNETRIGEARARFDNIERIFCSKDLSISSEVRLVRLYMFGVLLYGLRTRRWRLKLKKNGERKGNNCYHEISETSIYNAQWQLWCSSTCNTGKDIWQEWFG